MAVNDSMNGPSFHAQKILYPLLQLWYSRYDPLHAIRGRAASSRGARRPWRLLRQETATIEGYLLRPLRQRPREEGMATSSISSRNCFYLCDCASFLFCYRTAFTTQHIFPDRCQNGSCMTASRNNTSRRYGRFGTSRSRQEFPCRIPHRKTALFPVRCEIRTL